MPHNEAQAWWADVQHVRESIERRRAGLPDSSAPLSPPDEPRFSRRAAESLPVMDDLEWSSSLPARSRGRFDHGDTTDRRRRADDWGGYDGAWEDGWRSGRTREDSGRADEYDDEPLDFEAERAALEHDRSERDRRDRNRSERDRSERDRSDRNRTDRERRGHEQGERGRAERSRTDRRRAERDAGSDRDPARFEPAAAGAATALAPPPARRTVQITGRTVAAPALPRLVEVERRRPARRPAERVGPRPDRIALWAVLLGFFLILVAATSSNAATHPAGSADRAAVALHAPAR